MAADEKLRRIVGECFGHLPLVPTGPATNMRHPHRHILARKASAFGKTIPQHFVVDIAIDATQRFEFVQLIG